MVRLIEWWGGQSAWLRYGVALVLLLFAGPSDSEKKGYHF